MFKKVSLTALVLAAILGVSACTVYKPAEQVRTITVSAQGSVNIAPDLVSLKFVVRTIEWSVNSAVEKNAALTENVINAVKELGINEKDIATVDYKITQDNSNTYPGRFTVVNYISILVRNTENTGNIVNAAIINGANGLVDYEYLVSDETTSIRQARTIAIQNAQDAASLLAGASGCRTDAVLNIVENGITKASTAQIQKDSTFITAPTIEDTITVTSNVTVTYSLQ